MKKEVKELRKKGIRELFKDLNEERNKLLKLKFEVSQGKLKNISNLEKSRKRIAKILTIVSEKQWEEFEKQGEKNGK